MSQGSRGGLNRQGLLGDRKQDGSDKKDKKFEPEPARVGREQGKQKGPEAATRIPKVTPPTPCKLRLLKLKRIEAYLRMEEEFVANQERLKQPPGKALDLENEIEHLRERLRYYREPFSFLGLNHPVSGIRNPTGPPTGFEPSTGVELGRTQRVATLESYNRAAYNRAALRGLETELHFQHLKSRPLFKLEDGRVPCQLDEEIIYKFVRNNLRNAGMETEWF